VVEVEGFHVHPVRAPLAHVVSIDLWPTHIHK